MRSCDLSRARRHWILTCDPNRLPIPDEVHNVMLYNASARRVTVVPTPQPSVVEDIMLTYIYDSYED